MGFWVFDFLVGFGCDCGLWLKRQFGGCVGGGLIFFFFFLAVGCVGLWLWLCWWWSHEGCCSGVCGCDNCV